MDRATAILITLVAYKVVLLLIGLWGQRRTRSTEDFYLGGRRLGPVVAAVSAAASSSSAWTIIGVSGFAYSVGMGALWLFPACVGGFCLNWIVLAPGLRRVSRREGALTTTELLAGPEGRPLRRTITWVASTIVLVSLMLYVGSQLQGAGKTFASTFQDLGYRESVLIGGGIVVIYTMLGGFWAVSLTDTLQGLLMGLTAVLLPVAALVAVGGFDALADGLQAMGNDDFLSLTPGTSAAAGIGFVLGLLGIGLGYPGQPHVVNRIMALGGGERELRQARWVAIAWAVVVYSGMIVLGLCGRVLYPELASAEDIFIHATNTLFSPVVAGIMVAAVLSAIMSTADSQLLVAGSTVSHDMGLGGRSPKSMLRRSRLTVLALAAAAMVSALSTDEPIFKVVLFAWGAMGAAFGPLLLWTALTGRRPDPLPTLIAMILGCTLSVTAYYLFKAPDEKAMERVVPYVVVGLILLFTSRRAPGRA